MLKNVTVPLVGLNDATITVSVSNPPRSCSQAYHTTMTLIFHRESFVISSPVLFATILTVSLPISATTSFAPHKNLEKTKRASIPIEILPTIFITNHRFINDFGDVYDFFCSPTTVLRKDISRKKELILNAQSYSHHTVMFISRLITSISKETRKC
jgi:hypothetical protein